ncbi:MAG: hypothetical protein PWQ59_1430 [Thermoanaerobacterium sp.]|nr:hypothetical protein [Thermoanaerobacterium sp.]
MLPQFSANSFITRQNLNDIVDGVNNNETNLNNLDNVATKILTANKEVTVGTGGDFANLVDAFYDSAKYIKNGYTYTITVLSGHVIDYQIDIRDVNLSVTVNFEDDIINVINVDNMLIEGTTSSKAVFFFANVRGVINFNTNVSGQSLIFNCTGFDASSYISFIHLTQSNLKFNNIYFKTDLSLSKNNGIYLTNSTISIGYLSQKNVNYGVNYLIFARENSKVTIYNYEDTYNSSIYAGYNSEIYIDDVIPSVIIKNIHSDYGSKVLMWGSIQSLEWIRVYGNSNVFFEGNIGSQINTNAIAINSILTVKGVDNITITSSQGSSVFGLLSNNVVAKVEFGSTISLYLCTNVTTSQIPNTLTANGIIFQN